MSAPGDTAASPTPDRWGAPRSRRERSRRRALPADLARHGSAPRRRRALRAEHAREHVVVVHPPVHDDPRDRRARTDARGHAGGHRPLDRRRDLPLRERARRRERGLQPRSGGRNPRLRRPGGARRPRQRNPRRDRETEPADRHAGCRADRARVQLEVRAREHGLVAVPESLSSWAAREASRDQHRLLDGRRDRDRRRARASLHDRRPALPGGGCEPESGVDGRTARPNTRRVRVHGGGRSLRSRGDPARGPAHQHRFGASAPPTSSRRSPQSSSRALRSRADWRARRRPGLRRSRSRS